MRRPEFPAAMPELQRRYLDLLRKTVCNVFHQPGSDQPPTAAEVEAAAAAMAHVHKVFEEEVQILRQGGSPRADLLPEQVHYLQGLLLEWPLTEIAIMLRINSPQAHSLLPIEAFQNIEECLRHIQQKQIPGHLIECGVWRGGATIFMRGCLEALNMPERCVYLADSFQGLPQPDRQAHLIDAVIYELLKGLGAFRVSLDDVKSHFAAYDLLDQRVRFLPGWFHQTLPHFQAPLALIRLDGDWYDSTKVALESLYPQLSPGGFIIIDDYFPVFGAKRAVDEFRAQNAIQAELVSVTHQIHFWQKLP